MFKILVLYDKNPWRNNQSKLTTFDLILQRPHSGLYPFVIYNLKRCFGLIVSFEVFKQFISVFLMTRITSVKIKKEGQGQIKTDTEHLNQSICQREVLEAIFNVQWVYREQIIFDRSNDKVDLKTAFGSTLVSSVKSYPASPCLTSQSM